MSELNGRKILLTGASSGVGRHLAVLLASRGAHVVCCARRTADLETLVEEITAAGGTATAQGCDVADANSITAAFDAAERMVGAIDSVIVNAGVNFAGPASRLPIDQIDKILTINLRGALLTAREGAARMIASGAPTAETSRRIIFIASVLGKRPQAGAAVYSATKAAILMLARSLALEWARHEINVNAVLPGYMPTDIVSEWFASEGGKAQVESWPRKRMMPIGDLDPAVLFLLSPAARSVTGSELVVDDAQSLA